MAGAGNDTFILSSNLADHIDGGDGFDTVELQTNLSGFHSLPNIEMILLDAGFTYNLTPDGGGRRRAHLDGSAELDGFYEVIGGAGDDTIIGGPGGILATGGDGNDTPLSAMG